MEVYGQKVEKQKIEEWRDLIRMKSEILYPKRWLKIGESAAEIMLLFTELSSKGEVYSVMDDEINSCDLLNTIARMAVEFEIMYANTDDWLYDIDEFATKKLKELYGKQK